MSQFILNLISYIIYLSQNKLYSNYKLFTTTTTTSKMSRVCSYCACSGHNKATCEVRQITCIMLPQEEKQIHRSCSYCGCHGHDLRNCLAHQLLGDYFPEQEEIKTPVGVETPPMRIPSTVGPVLSLTSIKRKLTFSTPLKLSDMPPPPPSRASRSLPPTNMARQITQIIDYDIYDEPWVWAPIGKPSTSVVQPTPDNIIFI